MALYVLLFLERGKSTLQATAGASEYLRFDIVHKNKSSLAFIVYEILLFAGEIIAVVM